MSACRASIASAPLLLASAAASAHVESASGESTGAAGALLGEPWLAALLLAGAVVYALGWRELRTRSSDVRLAREGRLFAAGWLVLALATLSPLHAAGARSFALHMTEHELLMLIAAPLLALSRPLATMLWAFPPTARAALGRACRRDGVNLAWRAVSDPAAATALQAVALWAWHVPSLFERALVHAGWHYAQHVSFLGTALLFWWSITRGHAGRRGYGTGAFCLFVTSLVGGALGALMALSSSPWYAPYARLGLAPFGLTPAEDQQLAGLLMWIPGGLVHAGAALWMLASWLRRGVDDRDAEVSRAT